MTDQNQNIEVANTTDEPVFKLSRSFIFEEKSYTELPFDLESLTGNDLLLCERRLKEFNLNEELVMVKALSLPYQCLIASMAAKVPVELIRALPAKDFSRLTQRVQNFLLV